MAKCKALLRLMIIMALTLLILFSCDKGEDNKDTSNEIVTTVPSEDIEDSTDIKEVEEPTDTPIAEDPTPTPEAQLKEGTEEGTEEDTEEDIEEDTEEDTEEDNNDFNINLDAFGDLSYNATEVLYKDGDIMIKYPRITGLKDSDIEDKLNELIEMDAMKDVAGYVAEGATLEVDYEIAWAGEYLLSIKFIVYSSYPGAAHPNHAFYSTNIYLPMASKIKLTDTVKISDYFAQVFIRDSQYIAPLESGNEELDSALEGYVNSVDGAYLLKVDTEEDYNTCFSYFTEDSLGISIEVPFAAGGYALYEIAYDDIISYIYYENEIWKDFPDVLSKIESAGNDSAMGNIYDYIPEGWTILELYGQKILEEGDLDKDGNKDLAFVIEGESTENGAAPRTLMISFGNGDNTYTLSVEAKNAILRADEGGIWGEPFEGIEIKNGTIYIYFYGGSAWRWGNSYQFRYQEKDWYLIGATGSFINVGNNEGTERDYNLLTGDYIIKDTAADGTVKVTEGNYDKRNLYRLEDFHAGHEDIFNFEASP